MGNIAYFEVPADDVQRAKKFYMDVFGWDIKNTPMPNMPDYLSIMTGKPVTRNDMGTLNSGGMMKRMQPHQPITNYVEVKNIEETITKVKKLGGKQIGETMPVPTVGRVAFILDSEGNFMGIWEPEKKEEGTHV